MLPHELLLAVFQHLTTHELLNASLVCRRWRAAALDRVCWDHKPEPVWRSAPPLPGESVPLRWRRVSQQRVLWDRRRAFTRPRVVQQLSCRIVSLACTRQNVVALAEDGWLRAWHVHTLEPAGRSAERHDAPPFVLSEPSPNWRVLVSADEGGGVCTWDAESLRLRARALVPGVKGVAAGYGTVLAWSRRRAEVTGVDGEALLTVRDRVRWAVLTQHTQQLVVLTQHRLRCWTLPRAVLVHSEACEPGGVFGCSLYSGVHPSRVLGEPVLIDMGHMHAVMQVDRP